MAILKKTNEMGDALLEMLEYALTRKTKTDLW